MSGARRPSQLSDIGFEPHIRRSDIGFRLSTSRTGCCPNFTTALENVMMPQMIPRAEARGKPSKRAKRTSWPYLGLRRPRHPPPERNLFGRRASSSGLAIAARWLPIAPRVLLADEPDRQSRSAEPPIMYFRR